MFCMHLCMPLVLRAGTSRCVWRRATGVHCSAGGSRECPHRAIEVKWRVGMHCTVCLQCSQHLHCSMCVVHCICVVHTALCCVLRECRCACEHCGCG